MTIKDTWILFKETIRPRILHHPAFNQALLPKGFIKGLKLKSIKRIFRGNPNTITIITSNQVVRIPLDELSAHRCRNNKAMLIALQESSIKKVTPEFLEDGSILGRPYFMESRLPGVAIDVPISSVDYLVEKAADFITQWHRETAQEIEMNEENYNNLVRSQITAMGKLLSSENQDKLRQVERKLTKQLSGKRLSLVWSHGDYKLENVLFKIPAGTISGIIDWDLASRSGFVLLDVLYLLLYKSALLEGKTVNQLLVSRYLQCRFDKQEERILQKYSATMGLSTADRQPLLILFWLHNITIRNRQGTLADGLGREQWFADNIYKVLDAVLELK